MKMVVAYIRHEAFEPIRQELLEAGFPSLSISEVKGSGRQKGITEQYRGSELTIHLRPKLKLEIVVDDKDVSVIVETCHVHVPKIVASITGKKVEAIPAGREDD